MKTLLMILDRAKEPSSWAALTGVAAAVGVSAPAYAAVSTAIAGVAGALAFFLKEKGTPTT